MVKLLSKTFLILLIFGLIVISPVSYFYDAQYTYVYADSVTEPVNRDELVEAFRAYCKSRDLTIDGSIADCVTSFTTDTFNLLCNTLGIDVTAMQAEIQKMVDSSNGITKFIFSSTGVALMNRIFAQFLQDNDIEVGDQDVNKVLKSGKWFTDSDGRGVWCYILKNPTSNSDTQETSGWAVNASDLIIAQGSIYRFNQSIFSSLWDQYNNSTTPNYYINGRQYNFQFGNKSESGFKQLVAVSNLGGHTLVSFENGYYTSECNMGIFYNSATKHYIMGGWRYNTQTGSSNYHRYKYVPVCVVPDPVATDTDVTVVSPTVKAPLPDDEPVEIEPDGTIVEPEPEPVPPGGTLPDWTIPDGTITPDGNGGSTFDWNFQLPDLNIDWSINGLTNKFPFCIPFDVVNFCQVLSAEPVAPRISGSVPIGTLTTWTFDYDLSEYNAWASLLRTVELFGFVIGLIFITVKLVKG